MKKLNINYGTRKPGEKKPRIQKERWVGISPTRCINYLQGKYAEEELKGIPLLLGERLEAWIFNNEIERVK